MVTHVTDQLRLVGSLEYSHSPQMLSIVLVIILVRYDCTYIHISAFFNRALQPCIEMIMTIVYLLCRKSQFPWEQQP